MIFQQFFKRPDVAEVSTEEARAKQKAGVLLLDVRELYEMSSWMRHRFPVVR